MFLLIPFVKTFFRYLKKEMTKKLQRNLLKIEGANSNAVLVDNMTIKVKMLQVFINSFCEHSSDIWKNMTKNYSENF